MEVAQIITFIDSCIALVLTWVQADIKETIIIVFFANFGLIAWFCCFVVLLLQAYEWNCMVNLISYQKGKSMSEIMYEVNNSSTFKKF